MPSVIDEVSAKFEELKSLDGRPDTLAQRQSIMAELKVDFYYQFNFLDKFDSV